jgi:23S rRNA G2445 N2-methylase RlmL
MARAYPLIRVEGYDLDPDVIAAAQRNAEQAGLSGRVGFAVTDASGPDMTGRFDW